MTMQSGSCYYQKDTRCLIVVWQLVFSILFLLSLASASADESYYIYGRIFSVHKVADEVQGQSTSSLPGVDVQDPESANTPSPPVPLPGATIEAYNVETKAHLGSGNANREGYYNLSYMAPEADHTVRFLVYYKYANGGTEFIGEVNKTPAGDAIVVNNRLFSYDIQVISENSIRGGLPLFSSSGEFMFLEVGDIDMDDIYDKEQDPADPGKWGKTKSTAQAGPAPDTRSLGPDFGFGAALELYGLFGETSGARYYRINYTGPDTGSVADKLFKKNYVIAGTGVEVYKTLMGPKTITIGSVTLTDVYEIDEVMAGEPIPDSPGKFYSSYWTEQGVRAHWNTRVRANGKYELSVETWDHLGNPLPASTNNYATLSLHLVNTAPQSTIHNFRYLNGDVVLSDADPCLCVVLNKVSSPTFDDSLQFELTALHPDSAFFRNYDFRAWYGHNTLLGEISSGTTQLNSTIITTPSSISYHTCAYRFRLRVWPRITNGYHVIYVRDDNWFASINVLE